MRCCSLSTTESQPDFYGRCTVHTRGLKTHLSSTVKGSCVFKEGRAHSYRA